MKINFTWYSLITFCLEFIETIGERGHGKFSSGLHYAVNSVIYENKVSEVVHEWKKVMKDFKHEKVKDSDGEVFGDNISHQGLG